MFSLRPRGRRPGTHYVYVNSNPAPGNANRIITTNPPDKIASVVLR